MNLLSAEDLLQDNIVKTIFPNVWCLMKIYVLIPMSEAIVKRGLSKVGQFMMKKCTVQDDNSLETLMHISYHMQSLNTNDVKQVLELWWNQKERRLFSSDF